MVFKALFYEQFQLYLRIKDILKNILNIDS